MIPLCFCALASEVLIHFHNQTSFMAEEYQQIALSMCRLVYAVIQALSQHSMSAMHAQWLCCFSCTRGCRHCDGFPSLHIPKGNGWLWYRSVVLLWFCAMPVMDPKIYEISKWKKSQSPRQEHIWSNSLGFDTICSSRVGAVCNDTVGRPRTCPLQRKEGASGYFTFMIVYLIYFCYDRSYLLQDSNNNLQFLSFIDFLIYLM